MARIIKSKPH